MTNLLAHTRAGGCTRIEATAEAEQRWVDEVVRAHERMMFRRSKGWFTGYNSNVAGHHEGTIRYQAYFGGAPRYAAHVAEVAANHYPGIAFA